MRNTCKGWFKGSRDDENLAGQPSTEIMDLIMRNSMSLSKLKDEFKNI